MRQGMNRHKDREQHTPANTTIDEFDLTQDIMGDNALAADDQKNVPNQRHSQAGATGKTDGVIESFKKVDKKYRASRDGQRRQS